MTKRVEARRIGVLLAAGLAIGSVPVSVVDAAVPAAASSEPSRLARLMLDTGQVTALVRPGIEQSFKDDPRLRDIAARTPDFLPFVRQRLDPELTSLVRREMPALQQQTGRVLATHLDPSEMDVLADFLETPVGARIWQAGVKGATDPQAQRERLFDARMRQIMANLTPRDRRDLTRASPVLPKLNAAQPAYQAAIASHMAAAIARARPRLAAIATQAGKDYVAQHGGARR